MWHDTTAIPTKRRVLDLPTHTKLQAVADRHGLTVSSRYGLTVEDRRVKTSSSDGQAPMRLVDYTLATELAHLRHAVLDAHFGAAWEVMRMMPDLFRILMRREELRSVGDRLSW